MCGIIGFFNNENAFLLVKEGLEIIGYRGKDGYGIADSEEINFATKPSQLKLRSKERHAIGHALHSVVSFVRQPFTGKGRFVVNCEIYNWRELNEKLKMNARNDAELLFLMLEKVDLANNPISKIRNTLSKLDGVYAFAYWREGKVFVARDIVGEKPLAYSLNNGFGFASEPKALEKLGFKDVRELNPRIILEYDIKKKELKEYKRKFFNVRSLAKDQDKIRKELQGLIINSVAKRVPDQKFGILFSGGIDSTLIAWICKQLGLDFTCYTAVLDEPSMKSAEDLLYAKKVAKKLGFKLKVARIKLKDVEAYIKKVVPLIESTNVVKVGVGLTFYVACEMAKKDKVKVMFSGLGSEELFAGYERHKQSKDINKECYSGLLKIYERDTFRDDVITMFYGQELRLPFLDLRLIEYSLKIPAEMKINETGNKLILRQVARDLGVPKEFAMRKKRAAQYGSKFDKALEKLAKKQKKLKSEYLEQFLPKKNLKLGVLYSSGKDSNYAMWIMQKQNYDICCLVSIKSKNPDSFMWHTPSIDMAKVQAECLGIPLLQVSSQGKKEEELKDLERGLKEAISKFKIDGIVSGALFSNYQRERIEKICDKLGLKIFSPLWHIDQEQEMREMLKEGFEIVLVSIAAYGLDESMLGTKITDKEIDKLVNLNKEFGVNVAGEGGEYESLVLDMPMFKKKIILKKVQKIMENECTGRLEILEYTTEEKQ